MLDIKPKVASLKNLIKKKLLSNIILNVNQFKCQFSFINDNLK
jgi:hypothetical protein